MNEDGGIWLEPYSQGPIGMGVFEVPEGMDLYLNKLTDHGEEIESEAVSGQLTITRYEKGVGMAGYFDQIAFEGEDGACRPRCEDRDIGAADSVTRWGLDRCSIPGADGFTFTVVIERAPAHPTTGAFPINSRGQPIDPTSQVLRFSEPAATQW